MAAWVGNPPQLRLRVFEVPSTLLPNQQTSKLVKATIHDDPMSDSKRNARSNPKPAKKRRLTTKRNHCHSWEEVRVAAYILHAFKQLTAGSLKHALDAGDAFERSDMLLQVLGVRWVVEYDGKYWHSQEASGLFERYATLGRSMQGTGLGLCFIISKHRRHPYLRDFTYP